MIFLTAGESHGEALTGIINDYPSGIEIDTDFINSGTCKKADGIWKRPEDVDRERRDKDPFRHKKRSFHRFTDFIYNIIILTGKTRKKNLTTKKMF